MPEHQAPKPQSSFAPSSEQLDDWRIGLTTDMSEVKTMLKALVGNGQPGVIDKLETRVTALERVKNQMAGAIAVVSAVGGYFIHGLFAKGGH
jgi:hypothetical protein